LNIPSVTTFINLTQTGPIAEENLIKSLLGYWNFSGQSNPMREFIFKFLYNQLGLNCRVAHFVAGHGRACTLCIIAQRNNPADETFLHSFYDCPTTTTLREKLANKHFSRITNMSELEKRKFWFLGIDGNKRNLFTTLCVFAFSFTIWQMKLKKEILNFSTMELNWLEILDTCYKQNRQCRESILLANYDICRRWNG
jgi:hypothetical protein